MFPENNDFYFYNSTHFSCALVTKTVRSEQFSRNNMFTHLPVYQMCVWATEACVVFRLKRQVQCFWARTWDVTVLLWCQQSKSSKSQVLIKCQCVKRRRKREKEWWWGGGDFIEHMAKREGLHGATVSTATWTAFICLYVHMQSNTHSVTVKVVRSACSAGSCDTHTHTLAHTLEYIWRQSCDWGQ